MLNDKSDESSKTKSTVNKKVTIKQESDKNETSLTESTGKNKNSQGTNKSNLKQNKSDNLVSGGKSSTKNKISNNVNNRNKQENEPDGSKTDHETDKNEISVQVTIKDSINTTPKISSNFLPSSSKMWKYYKERDGYKLCSIFKIKFFI